MYVGLPTNKDLWPVGLNEWIDSNDVKKIVFDAYTENVVGIFLTGEDAIAFKLKFMS